MGDGAPSSPAEEPSPDGTAHDDAGGTLLGAGRRVLIEHTDLGVAAAAELMLRRLGFEVDVCGGPDQLRRGRCPLVAGQGCDMVERADLVFHGLDLDHTGDRAVLRALRAHHAGTPLVVEASPPKAHRHEALLDDCVVVSSPLTGAALVEATRRALAEVPGAGDDADAAAAG